MNKEEKIEAAFREMANLAGGRLPESDDLAKRRLTCRELDDLYLPETDPDTENWIGDQCRYQWAPSKALQKH